ncbi:MAG: hypothetical protein AMXMBFR64_34600 [Myxococcales bacterium]
MRSTFIALALVCVACADDPVTAPADVVSTDVPDTGSPSQPDSSVPADAPVEVAPEPDVTGECAGPLKGFLCPCTGTSDCESGFCVDSPQGPICTRECLSDQCPEGFACRSVLNLLPDVVFICVPDALRLCAPCQTDDQCGSGVCLDLAGGRFCTQACSSAACAPGYSCAQDPSADALGLGPVCLPQTGSCDCAGDQAGATRPCSVTDEGKTCWGVETCDPSQGWVGCTAAAPAPEECNGVDDDCNGTVDDGLPVDQTCVKEEASVGACQGTDVCLGVNGWLCNAPSPSPELCNFKDDDCDGLVDEDFRTGDLYAATDHCGTCNKSCAQAGIHGVAICDASKDPPQCVIESCDEGFFKLNEYQCIPVTTSLCQPCAKDTDCFLDGARCMALGDGKYCGKECGGPDDCPFGYSCLPWDGGSQCQPASGTCSCDGSNPDLKKACSLTWADPADPTTPATTCVGIQSCGPGGWEPCVLPADVCDGKDNDCNGAADEAFVDAVGRYVSDNHCGKCDNNCAALPVDNGVGVCDPAPLIPACALKCDGGWVDVNGNPVDGCECQIQPGDDVPDGVDSDCDGVDGEVQNAVFVAKNGSDGGAGTQDEPVLTVQRGIDRAVELGLRDVYVATGVYQESVLAATGVGVYGGYSADFTVRDRVLYETVLMGVAPSAGLPAAVNILDPGTAATPTAIDGVTVFGHSTSLPGKSSYAVMLRNVHAGVVVSNATINAGNGGDGLPGSAGVSGTAGEAGQPGLGATEHVECAGKTNPGGAGGTMACGAVDVSGGGGGTSVCPDYDESGAQPYSPPITQSPAPGEGGAPGANNAGPGGAGGVPGWDFLKWSAQVCTNCISPPAPNTWVGEDGKSGVPGLSGLGGQACAGDGVIIAGEWVAAQPTSGGPGSPGGGGGGGGAGGGVELSSCGDGGTDLGGSGGGGGAGGCAGGPGGAASSGGGSFGVFLVWTTPPVSAPTLLDNTIRSGNGGKGGAGGQGGVGGAGGDGASGGASGAANPTTQCAGQGGHGGAGGSGGHGGGGGGGCGGPSFALFAAGQGPLDLSPLKASNAFQPGGTGGLGGSGGVSVGEPGEGGAFGPTGSANF